MFSWLSIRFLKVELAIGPPKLPPSMIMELSLAEELTYIISFSLVVAEKLPPLIYKSALPARIIGAPVPDRNYCGTSVYS